jgi:hypothetical protein
VGDNTLKKGLTGGVVRGMVADPWDQMAGDARWQWEGEANMRGLTLRKWAVADIWARPEIDFKLNWTCFAPKVLFPSSKKESKILGDRVLSEELWLLWVSEIWIQIWIKIQGSKSDAICFRDLNEIHRGFGKFWNLVWIFLVTTSFI